MESGGQQVAEIEIEGQDDAAFPLGHLEDVGVG
jgi:hypothetical protein